MSQKLKVCNYVKFQIQLWVQVLKLTGKFAMPCFLATSQLLSPCDQCLFQSNNNKKKLEWHLDYWNTNAIATTVWWWQVRNRPGRLLRLFLEPKSLTREKTFSRLGFSQFPLVLLGLLTQRQAFVFSRSLACLFCLMRELAIAAAMASFAALRREELRFGCKLNISQRKPLKIPENCVSRSRGPGDARFE